MRINRRNRTNVSNDLGFGTKSTFGRSLNKDGSFNVKRVGLPLVRHFELYNKLISISWINFLILVFVSYIIINFLFALIYLAIGIEHLAGIEGKTPSEQFLDAFFFSSQTLTTLGYGRISPTGVAASITAAIESMLGLLGFAMATGLLYGRFSKPKANIHYSTNAIIAPYRGTQRALMFRMANMRSNQLIEVEVDVSVAILEPGATTRSFYQLNLERKKINLFPLSWTIVHPLDESSPLYGLSHAELLEENLELFILVKAFDDTFSQTVYSRTYYSANELVWGAKFLPMFSVQPDGSTKLDMRLIDAAEKVELPPLAKPVELLNVENSEDPTV